jgi:membrane protease YdiL (CAAX protease family)
MEPARETLAARRPAALTVFLLLAFGLSWLAFLPLITGVVRPATTAGEVLLPLVGIGSPGIAAFVVAGVFAGRPGVRALLHAGGRGRVGIRWYAIVLLLPVVAYSAWWMSRLGSPDGLPSVEVWIAAVVSGLLAGALEEFGWSGVAFPALFARFGLLRAGSAMGIVVALWHLPLFLTPGQPQQNFGFLPFLLTLIPVRILFGWVYLGTGGSVLLCVLFHASGNAWSEIFSTPVPDFSRWWVAETAVFTVAAAAVLVRHSAAWRGNPGRRTPLGSIVD